MLSMENTLLYMGDGGAVKLFWVGGEWPRKTRRVAGAGHAEGSECRGFPFGLQKLKGLSGQRLAGAAPARRRAQGEDVSVYMRARVANTKVISPCSFFLCLRRRWPRGSGRPARAEVEGPDWS